jgi:hypothetical protein
MAAGLVAPAYPITVPAEFGASQLAAKALCDMKERHDGERAPLS